MDPSVGFTFDNTYARLPQRFYAEVAPTPVRRPRVVRINASLARDLGIDPDALLTPEGAEVLAGNRIPVGAEPIALAYAGHQFGHFVPQLGDGRAILLGEVVGRDGGRRDIQLKGAGPTPFSRRGDGRAAIGPVLREYLISEAMAAFGVPTTRALAAATTGEVVLREEPLPGAVFTRVASSHIRVGTFQFFAARRDTEALRVLADYAIHRHYPDAAGSEHPHRALFAAVVTRQAELIARWMLLGFIHGVMNTDNTSISGETIDYGPCAFMDAYDPATVFSSIDEMGRYAYGSQPRIAQWNLARLAEAILPLLAPEEDAAIAAAQEALEAFGPRFMTAYSTGLRRKIGLQTEREGDGELVNDLLARMGENSVDFTRLFRQLCDAAEGPAGDEAARGEFINPVAFDDWATRWRSRLAEEAPSGRAALMRGVNPAYIPRNHLVEEALQAAAERDDFGPFEALLEVLARPFDERPGLERFAAAPLPTQRVRQTFCGT